MADIFQIQRSIFIHLLFTYNKTISKGVVLLYVEYKFGFRPEGTVAAALVGCVTGIICGAFSGCYETGLSMNGYLPEKGVNQVPGVVNWIYFVRYVVPIIEYVALIILLKFMDLEKKLPKMQAEIQERHRRGQV